MPSLTNWVDYISFLLVGPDKSIRPPTDQNDDDKYKCNVPYTSHMVLQQDSETKTMKPKKCLKTEHPCIHVVTTQLLINIFPIRNKSNRDIDNPDHWVKAEYIHRPTSKSEKFILNGSLDDILPDYDDRNKKDDGADPIRPVDDFFGSFLFFLRYLRCKIWLNGYVLEFPIHPSNRFDIITFDLEPFKLVLYIANLKDMKIERKSKEIVVLGIEETFSIEKWFAVHDYGGNVTKIKMNIPKDGTLIFSFPVYQSLYEMTTE